MTDLLTVLAGGQHAESPAPSRPHMAAQCMELTRRYASLLDRHCIKPGMLVREKAGIGHLRTDAEFPLIVIRMLIPGNAFDDELVRDWIRTSHVTYTGHGLDCVVGHLTDDATALVMRLMPSTILEPLPTDHG